MLSADTLLCERMKLRYNSNVQNFFEDLLKENFTEAELNAIPALFLPGWGKMYCSSVLKIAVAGKETLGWGNEFGDSLLADINAFRAGKYIVNASCKRY